ncbi:hypothetical protein D3C78_1006990 [compost metagenome]
MHRKIVVEAHHRHLAARADAVLFADLEQAFCLVDRFIVSAQASPAHQKPCPFELVARLHDPALVAVVGCPVMGEELAQPAIAAIDEAG